MNRSEMAPFELSDADLARLIRCRQLRLVAPDDIFDDADLDDEATRRGWTYSTVMNNDAADAYAKSRGLRQAVAMITPKNPPKSAKVLVRR